MQSPHPHLTPQEVDGCDGLEMPRAVLPARGETPSTSSVEAAGPGDGESREISSPTGPSWACLWTSQVNRRNLTKTPQRGSGRVKIQPGCVGPGPVPPCLRLWASLLELQDAWAPEPFLVLSVAKGRRPPHTGGTGG
ncbi:uncharacterized protein LOC122237157 isoform X2 [Panthera tigris]|uniref:uncharacterized protein LOC122237157 isoform X2 n=1 Tax=Panthera tigris TaxID=9694 RepID=UPI001C6F7686|nr:uncharacterized protein LOC122237157 isoform X2 [Panthera tigris]